MKRSILLSIVAIFALALPVAAADKALEGHDKDFVMKAAKGGLMEVQLGQLAKEKAQAQEVKDFGARMVTDHGKANDELKKLAQQKNLTLPADLDPKHQSMMDGLKKASGADFDKQYMREMVKDHAKAVGKFRAATKSVKDPDLNAWAAKTLPVLEQHMEQARAVAQKVGVDVGKAEEEGRQAAEKKEMKK